MLLWPRRSAVGCLGTLSVAALCSEPAIDDAVVVGRGTGACVSALQEPEPMKRKVRLKHAERVGDELKAMENRLLSRDQRWSAQDSSKARAIGMVPMKRRNLGESSFRGAEDVAAQPHFGVPIDATSVLQARKPAAVRSAASGTRCA